MAIEKMVPITEVHLESDPNKGNMVVLKENAAASHYFMMFVGDSEFAAIAKEKGLVQPSRPLTHDLYLSILDKLDLEFVRIEIHDVKEETFFAHVILRVNGVEHTVDSRPSDAVALALHKKIAILVRQDLFRRELTRQEIKEYQEVIKSVKF